MMVSCRGWGWALVSLLLLSEIEGFIPNKLEVSNPSLVNADCSIPNSKVCQSHKTLTNLHSVHEKTSPETRREWLTKLISCTGASAAATLNIINPNVATASTTISPTIPNLINAPAGSALCEPTVSSWYRGSRIIHILGTAHISEDSAQLAGKLIREMQPKAVFVELDAKRVGRVMPASAAKKGSDVAAVGSGSTTLASEKYVMPTSSTPASMTSGFNPFGIRDGLLRKAGGALVGDSIKKLYQNLESQGFSAGEEFAISIREGLNIDATIVLGDQDVNYTLQRLADAIYKTDIKKLLSPDSDFEKSIQDILPSQLKDQINQQQDATLDAKQLSLFVETMKTKENVKLIMDNFKIQAPEIHFALVGERDLFMATGLDRLETFDSTVAVMGLAHVDGVETNLQKKGWLPIPIKCKNAK